MLSLGPFTRRRRARRPTNTVDTGVLAGAPYYIEIPVKWNKGLVLYTHGYTPEGSKPPQYTSPQHKAFREVFLSRGFAFAASDYSRQGWAVKEGIEETEALRRHFVTKHGQPAETYITGHSMGGHITMAILERHPEAYQGGLPMCGPLGGALEFLNAGPFDMLVTFEAIFRERSDRRTRHAPVPETGSTRRWPLIPSAPRGSRNITIGPSLS